MVTGKNIVMAAGEPLTEVETFRLLREVCVALSRIGEADCVSENELLWHVVDKVRTLLFAAVLIHERPRPF